MKRDVCQYCGIDAGIGPICHTRKELCIAALKDDARIRRRRILSFVKDHLEEVHNHIGGVVGYKLNLDDEETDQLLKEIEE